MPQKKNPDPAEIMRSRGAALSGPLVAMLAVLKGLPSGYNRDLQEDKSILFGAVDAARASLEAAALLPGHLVIRRDRMTRAAAEPALYATEIADHLAASGVPFRDAHEAIGRAVRLAESRGVPLDRLDTGEWNAIHPGLGESAALFFDAARALERRSAIGGTSPRRLEEAVETASRRIASDGTMAAGKEGSA